MKFLRWGSFITILFITSCAPQPTQEVPAEFKLGQKHFHKICSNCHGSDAMGKQTKAPKLIDTDYIQETFSDDDIFQTVIEGTDKMPSQRNKVSDEEIKEIIKYLRYSQLAANLVAMEEDEEEETLMEEDPEKAEG
jgi:mono/diheme cytochrome c family protein